MMRINLEAPWDTFQKKVKALFESDPDIDVLDICEDTDSDAHYCFSIEVKKHEKFVALDRLLPRVRSFGNVKLRIYIYDMENNEEDPTAELYRTLFNGNPILKDVVTKIDICGVAHDYVRFEPQVIQFFDDDLRDYEGNWSGLAQDIAREVFDSSNWLTQFCTANIHENK